MESFEGKIAVVTGGASGMGRAAGAAVGRGRDATWPRATCPPTSSTRPGRWPRKRPPTSGSRRTCADVSSEEAGPRVPRRGRRAARDRPHPPARSTTPALSGGGSLFTDTSGVSGTRCFDVCWGGVYYGTRAFLRLLVAADEGHIINTSQRQRLLGRASARDRPHTAYIGGQVRREGLHRGADHRPRASTRRTSRRRS